jgi:hypothetical protein
MEGHVRSVELKSALFRWVLVAVLLLGGTAVAAEPQDASGGWVDTDNGMRFGLMSFELRGDTPEWNLGFGKALSEPGASGSYFGAGLSVRRDPYDPESLLPEPEILDGVGVGAWVGGCVNCSLGKIVELNLEAKWAPGEASLLGDGEQTEERRLGAYLRFRW